jgi:hypothetical protein
VELEGPHGKNDGSVQGVAYFHCAKDCGIFVREEYVEAVPLSHEREKQREREKEEEKEKENQRPALPYPREEPSSSTNLARPQSPPFLKLADSPSNSGGRRDLALAALLRAKVNKMMEVLQQQLELVQELEKKASEEGEEEEEVEVGLGPNEVEALKEEMFQLSIQELELVDGFRRRLATV